MITLALSLLLFHGLVGAADVLISHELVTRLPRQDSARHEELLHGLRELVFAMLFGSLAWLQWMGATIWWIVLLLVMEFVISLVDALLEDRTRQLPAIERGLHVVLFTNFGACAVVLALVLQDWHNASTAVTFIHHGVLSWLLSAFALGSFIWCLRDISSYLRLVHRHRLHQAHR